MTSSAREVVVVTPESPWPTRHGGRRRAAEIVQALKPISKVVVVHPAGADDEAAADCGLRTIAVETSAPKRIRGTLSRSRLGETLAAPLLPDLTQLQRAGAAGVVWSHSYLAATGIGRVGFPLNIVDFANIESERFRSLAAHGDGLPRRGSLLLESLKARNWEPKIAKAADLALAITGDDYQQLNSWGANCILARNGLEKGLASGPSPSHGPVLAVGNWGYPPNRDGLAHFIQNVWPAVRRIVGWARLEVAGTGSEHFARIANDANVVPLGFVPDLAPVYGGASVVLAPARSGGGSQLKVAEAWAHGRVVVGPTYLQREFRNGLPEGALMPSADLVGTLVRVLNESSGRHDSERELASFVAHHSWKAELSEMVEQVERLLLGDELSRKRCIE